MIVRIETNEFFERETIMEQINKKNNNLDSRIAYGVLLPVLLLIVIGMLSLYVALSHDSSVTNVQGSMMYQALWYMLGAIAIVIIMNIPPRVLWQWTPALYSFGLVLMILLLFLGDKDRQESQGSLNWFAIGTRTFQPSELMKIAYILFLAYIITKHNTQNKNRTIKSDLTLIGKMILVTIPIVILLLIQDDFGTLLVFVSIFVGMFLMSGITWRIEIPAFFLMITGSIAVLYLAINEHGRALLYKLGIFKPYQFARIDAWLDPFKDSTGDSYQQANGLLAIGSGGIFGKGFNSTDVHVPVRESDMIFTVIGENFGFIGGCFIILIYFILIYQMIKICLKTNNEFYAYIATGIIMMILFHVFENIGANIGLLPLTGIPLPFISQGGSSILCNMIGVGLIMSMQYQKDNDGSQLYSGFFKKKLKIGN